MQSGLILFSVLSLGLIAATPVDITKFNQIQHNEDVAFRNSILENAILQALEGLRKDMVQGTNDIPVLDPLDVEHLELNEELLTLPGLTIGSGLYYSITTSNVNFSLKGFDSNINGLMNDPGMSEFINTFLKHFVPDAVVVYHDDITKILSETVMEVGNELLKDLNLGSILG
ncbi:hypothetical protein HF086_003649 [Spodoptera exigua]|uniref:Uncharacterized protein n=1 Tax=Spodoptera exigua TaxID=7107 RepID=A0A922SMX7_SPOEX|nr:hypothetical protein HF086_003649 [Spodoptera exigua]